MFIYWWVIIPATPSLRKTHILRSSHGTPKHSTRLRGWQFHYGAMGLSINGGTQNGWFIRFIRENPTKMDDDWR